MDKEGWDFVETEPAELRNLVTVVWSGDDGEPAPGMLEAIVPFDGPDQIARVGAPLEAVDLSDKELTGNVQLFTGLDGNLASNPGTIRLYVRSGPTGVTAYGPARPLDATGSWLTLALDASDPDSVAAGYDSMDVREIGVEFGTNGATDSASVAVVLVDTVAY
jgi:hypothetical protein